MELLSFSLFLVLTWFRCVQRGQTRIHRVAVKAVCRSNKNHQFMTSAYIPKSPGLDLFETVINFFENICIFLRIHLEMNKNKKKGFSQTKIRKQGVFLICKRLYGGSAMTKFYGDVIQSRIDGDRIWGWNEFRGLVAIVIRVFKFLSLVEIGF